MGGGKSKPISKTRSPESRIIDYFEKNALKEKGRKELIETLKELKFISQNQAKKINDSMSL